MSDAAFVAELKSWIRFSAADAMSTGDGLFAATSGNPAVPTLDGQHNDGLVLYALVRERKVREANPQLSRYRGVRIKEKQQGALG